MKVVFLARNLIHPITGAQIASRKILDSIKNQARDLEIFVLTDQISKVRGRQIWRYTQQGFPLKIFGLNFEINNFFATRALNKIVKKIDPDLIHVNGYSGFYPKPPKEKVRSLLTFHDNPLLGSFVNLSINPLISLEHIWYERAKQIRISNLTNYGYYHVLSTESAKSLMALGVDRKRILVLPNGMYEKKDLNKDHMIFKNLKRKIYKSFNLTNFDKIVISVGLINRRKGIHVLVEALDYLPDNIHLLLVGSPLPLVGKNFLKKILKEKHANKVHYIGFQSKELVLILMRISDCYVSSSLSEACQLTPIEASLMGTPVVLTDVGAASDIYGSNYEYLLKPNSAKDLADKIMQSITNKRKKEENVRILSWNEIGKSLIAYYKKILQNVD